jgi:hypothetical protein
MHQKPFTSQQAQVRVPGDLSGLRGQSCEVLDASTTHYHSLSARLSHKVISQTATTSHPCKHLLLHDLRNIYFARAGQGLRTLHPPPLLVVVFTACRWCSAFARRPRTATCCQRGCQPRKATTPPTYHLPLLQVLAVFLHSIWFAALWPGVSAGCARTTTPSSSPCGSACRGWCTVYLRMLATHCHVLSVRLPATR